MVSVLDVFAPENVTAVVFAGPSGPPAHQSPGAPGTGGRNKNFFLLRERPVVQRQLDMLRKLPFRRLALVTESARLPELDVPAGTTVIEARRHQQDNFAAVKETLPFGEDERCLVLFGDTPIVGAGALTDFLDRCRASPADVHHGLVPYVFVAPFMDFFPWDHAGRRPFHLREFLARLGCLSLARPAAFDPDATRKVVAAVMRGRKQDPTRGGFASVLIARARVLWGGLRFVGPRGAWMGASAIVAHWLHERGFPQAARYVRRPVTLERLDAVASQLLSCRARFLPCPFGGTSLDIDNDVDLQVHELYLDQILHLQELQERIARKLVEPGFELTWQHLVAIERFDPAIAGEIRRHPEIYREQRRILLAFPRGIASVSHAA